jgi:hypothetical protein
MTTAWFVMSESEKHCRGPIALIQMKQLRLPKSMLGLGFVCLWLAGCETTGPQAAAPKRFHEDATTDLILRFNRWDTIHMLRPDTRQAGFLQILTRADVERELKTVSMGQNLAVVVVGFLLSQQQEAELAREWDSLLMGHGFRRVVLLRAGSKKDIDGLIIVHDSSIAAGHEKPATTATNRPRPPAA